VEEVPTIKSNWELTTMPSWLLLICLLIVWMLWLFSCMAEVALSEARRGIPEGERRSVSIFPGIPVFPLAFWGIAMLVDWFATPWGTVSIASLHVVLGVAWAVSIFKNQRALAKIDRQT
jgi:hypothetical protein